MALLLALLLVPLELPSCQQGLQLLILVHLLLLLRPGMQGPATTKSKTLNEIQVTSGAIFHVFLHIHCCGLRPYAWLAAALMQI
jgi:hypothetical protein